MVDYYAAFFNCTPVGRASDSLMPPPPPFKAIHFSSGWGRSFLSVAWLTGVQLVFFFCSTVSKLFGAIVGQLTQSESPRFLFIMVVIVIYLFVLDDSLTS